MHYLSFDLSEGDDGIVTLEAMASTEAAQHPAVLAEAQRVLDWAWQHFPQGHGPVEEGMDWDHDLQVVVEGDRWHTVTLALTGSPAFVEAFLGRFGTAED